VLVLNAECFVEGWEQLDSAVAQVRQQLFSHTDGWRQRPRTPEARSDVTATSVPPQIFDVRLLSINIYI
jgi:hypothetical protein